MTCTDAARNDTTDRALRAIVPCGHDEPATECGCWRLDNIAWRCDSENDPDWVVMVDNFGVYISHETDAWTHIVHFVRPERVASVARAIEVAARIVADAAAGREVTR